MKVFQMYRIYIDHHFGNASVRFLLLTNYAVYILTFPSTRTEKGTGDEQTKLPHETAKYFTEVVVPYSLIDYISVGLFVFDLLLSDT